jgi:putative DNA primase/helicase
MTFEQALRLAGLRPRDVVADGRIRRCDTESKPGRRNGWYVLNPDGHGSYGDWATGGSEALGHWRDDRTTVDPAALARQQALVAKNRERERAARVQAIRGARQFWNMKARPVRSLHPYLANKGLAAQGTAGLRACDGWLVIPVMFRGSVISVQRISATGEKLFWPGAPVKGGYYLLDRPSAAVTVLCEGFSTGLAVYQCMRHARVVVAFDAGNLQPVTNELRPTGSVVFVADNDKGTLARRGFNPGIDKAKNAAELIGAGVMWFEGIEGTDAADALKQWGQPGARRIERLILAGARYVERPG